jgi:hypothetical protein
MLVLIEIKQWSTSVLAFLWHVYLTLISPSLFSNVYLVIEIDSS